PTSPPTSASAESATPAVLPPETTATVVRPAAPAAAVPLAAAAALAVAEAAPAETPEPAPVAAAEPQATAVLATPATKAPAAAAGKTKIDKTAPQGELAETAATPRRNAAVSVAVEALAASAQDDAGGSDAGGQAAVQTASAKPTADKPVDGLGFVPTTAPAAQAAAAPTAVDAGARATPDTVAHLATQILKKVDAHSSRFDVTLNPEGLGRVNVKIEISADGKLTASMAFDTTQAASELRNRAGELRHALSQAGFEVSDKGLSFDSSNQNSGQGGQTAYNFGGGEDGRRAWNGRAFQAALTDDPITLALPDLPPGLKAAASSGVDVRI
ncbi:MAG: hypothetical protein JWP92_299, partial [Caulobacter sp.]|nr:hypothetical protein [Caulobacter sp.]